LLLSLYHGGVLLGRTTLCCMVQHFDGVHPFIGTHVEVDHIILLLFCLSGGAIPLVLEFVGLHMDLWHGGGWLHIGERAHEG
jgi:hypothetical protein